MRDFFFIQPAGRAKFDSARGWGCVALQVVRRPVGWNQMGQPFGKQFGKTYNNCTLHAFFTEAPVLGFTQ